MKKILSVLTVLALILTLLTPVILAQSAPELPENTPLIIEHAINNGKIEYNDEIALKLELYDRIYSAYMNFETLINISDLSIQFSTEGYTLIDTCINYFLNNTLCIYDESSLDYSLAFASNSSSYVQIRLIYTNVDIESMKSKIETTKRLVSDIAKKVPNNISDIAKMLYVHDYLAVNFEYDTSLEYRTVYDFLTQKSGVCSAYALTFAAIMNELGIPVTSAYSDEGNHQWNIVLLNNKFYHIDCTWADPIPDSYGVAIHDFFLLSDSQLDLADANSSEPDSHINDYTLENKFFGLNISCTDTTYDSGYIWNNSNTAFAYYNGAFYYIEDKSYTVENEEGYTTEAYSLATIYKTTNFKTNQEILKLNSSLWYTDSSNTYFHPGYFTGFDIIGSQLYFNDAHSVKYYDLENHKSGTVFENDDNILSFHYLGKGEFGYTTHSHDDNHTNVENTLTLTDKGHIYDNTSDSFNSDLAAMRKYLLGNHDDNICLVKGDLSGDDSEINILDFVALKKLAAQGL